MELNKKKLFKVVLSIIIFIVLGIIKIENQLINLVGYLIGYFIVGSEVVIKAIKNIFHGEVFDENFLMSIATIGAFIIGEYPEAMAVMLFYQIGEMFQDYAVEKSRKSISELMNIRPDYANVKINNEIQKVAPCDVALGEIIVVSAGEKVPLDGVIIEGKSMIDTSALTGESVPREVDVGDEILSGCINLNGVLEIEVKKEFGESTVSKILDLVENASSKKASTEKWITKFARYYTPIVVFIALAIAIFPSIILKDISWVYRALTFLVVSCPCALVISVPLSFFGGIGGASKSGILVKGSNYLEALAKTEIVVFDKTGTLTKGVFEVQKIETLGRFSQEEMLENAVYAEYYSNHPISKSLKDAYEKEIQKERIKDAQELAGLGIKAIIDEKTVYVGNSKLMKQLGIENIPEKIIGTVVHIVIDKEYAGYILISDKVKTDAQQAILLLKKNHVKETIMLTGDNSKVAQEVGKQLEIDKVYSELLPENKVEKLEMLLKEKSKQGKLVFVGDGINDAPVLARADIGIAMGGLGQDAAIEAADVVIMTDEPSKINEAIRISKKTLKIANENIVFAISVKVFVLILSVLGVATMWEAVFADVGVTVIAILNSFRTLRKAKN